MWCRCWWMSQDMKNNKRERAKKEKTDIKLVSPSVSTHLLHRQRLWILDSTSTPERSPSGTPLYRKASPRSCNCNKAFTQWEDRPKFLSLSSRDQSSWILSHGVTYNHRFGVTCHHDLSSFIWHGPKIVPSVYSIIYHSKNQTKCFKATHLQNILTHTGDTFVF